MWDGPRIILWNSGKFEMIIGFEERPSRSSAEGSVNIGGSKSSKIDLLLSSEGSELAPVGLMPWPMSMIFLIHLSSKKCKSCSSMVM